MDSESVGSEGVGSEGEEQTKEQVEEKQQIQESAHGYKYRAHKKGKKYKINTSRSRGELKLIKMLVKEHNWVEVFKEGDVMWSGLAIPDQQVGIGTQIRVNRIPAMPHICHKRTMGYILNKFREFWPEEFWFYPKTYLLPQDEHKLQNKIKKGGIFIAKPSIGCQGDGIVLIKKLSDIPKIGGEWIVQPYIDNPLLIEKKKFDFRLYVLIASIDPYICYINEEGLARFCSEVYEKPTKQNFKNPYIHLTNYSLNKSHPSYVNGDDAFSRGGKRCLKVIWDDLEKEGVDVGAIKDRIIVLTQKYLTGIYPFLKYYYNATFPKKNGKNFHVLGIDVLVDDKLNPWLLEANNNPSFNIEHEVMATGPNGKALKENSPVDEYVKKIVMEDTIYLTMRSQEKQQQMQIGDNFYSYKKILDANSEDMQSMNMIENILALFHSQCSIRSKWVLTASQFGKLARLTGMTSEKLTKNDYHLVFIKIMRDKPNPNQMQFEHFIEAIEYIVKEVVGYTKENKLEVMQEHIDFLVSQL